MKNINKKYLFLLLIFFVFSFGQIPKLEIIENLKISFLDLLVGLFSFFALLKIKSRFKKPYLFIPGFLFIGCSIFITIIQAFLLNIPNFLLNISYLARFSIYFFFYLSLTNLLIKKDLKFLDNGLFFSGFLVSVFGIIQYFLYPNLRNLMYLGWDPHYYRLFSTFFDPNFTGVILVLTLFQTLFILKSKKTIKFYLALFILFISIFLTRSRSTLVSLFIGLASYLLLFRKIGMGIIFGLTVGVIIFVFLPKPDLEILSLLRTHSVFSRIVNIQESLKLGLQAPFIGHGFFRARLVGLSFLSVFVGVGIFGFLIFVYLWKKILEFGIKKSNEVLIITLILLISSIFNNTLFYPWILFWFFTFLAGREIETDFKVRRKQ